MIIALAVLGRGLATATIRRSSDRSFSFGDEQRSYDGCLMVVASEADLNRAQNRVFINCHTKLHD